MFWCFRLNPRPLQPQTNPCNQSLTSLGFLRARLQELKEKYIENEQRVDNAEMAAQEANKLALRAEEVSIELGTTLSVEPVCSCMYAGLNDSSPWA